VQIAAALGAKVVAIDVDDERLAMISSHGAAVTLNTRAMSPKDLKNAVREAKKDCGRVGWKIFETSGTAAGQQTAFGLLDFGAYLGVVGYTPDKVELRLSNLMAFDATARGNWGCAPEYYPEILRMVLDGSVALAPFVEQHALAQLPDIFEAARNHETKRRPVMVAERSDVRPLQQEAEHRNVRPIEGAIE